MTLQATDKSTGGAGAPHDGGIPALLHLDCSAGDPDISVSRRLSAVFAEKWKDVHGAEGYRYRDFAADPVPLVSRAYTSLGRRVEGRGLVPLAEVPALVESEAEEREFALTLPLVTEVLAAQTVLIGTPMYNFSVPASLKAWIDRITFPGAFVDLETGESLLSRTRLVVVASRGGAYGPGSPKEGCDFQIPYLRAFFANLGLPKENMSFVHADMTVADLVPALAGFREMAANSLASALDEAARLALVGEPA